MVSVKSDVSASAIVSERAAEACPARSIAAALQLCRAGRQQPRRRPRKPAAADAGTDSLAAAAFAPTNIVEHGKGLAAAQLVGERPGPAKPHAMRRQRFRWRATSATSDSDAPTRHDKSEVHCIEADDGKSSDKAASDAAKASRQGIRQGSRHHRCARRPGGRWRQGRDHARSRSPRCIPVAPTLANPPATPANSNAPLAIAAAAIAATTATTTPMTGSPTPAKRRRRLERPHRRPQAPTRMRSASPDRGDRRDRHAADSRNRSTAATDGALVTAAARQRTTNGKTTGSDDDRNQGKANRPRPPPRRQRQRRPPRRTDASTTAAPPRNQRRRPSRMRKSTLANAASREGKRRTPRHRSRTSRPSAGAGNAAQAAPASPTPPRKWRPCRSSFPPPRHAQPQTNSP